MAERVEEAVDPLQLVLGLSHHVVRRGEDGGSDGAQVEQVGAGHEEDRQRRRGVDAGGPQVGLERDQQEAGRDQDGERDEAVPEPARLRPAPIEPVEKR